MHVPDDEVTGFGSPAPDDPRRDHSPAELDRLISHYRQLLHGHRWEVRIGSAEMVAHALSAIEDIQRLLRELRDRAPPEQRIKIEAILRQT